MRHHFPLLVSALLLARTGQAQTQLPPSPPLVAEQQLMQQASVIFEGVVLRATVYPNADSSRLCHNGLVRVTRRLKGTLPAETVQVVSRGSQVTVVQDRQTGAVEYAEALGPSHGTDDSQGASALPVGQTVVLFCRPLPPGPIPPPHFPAAGGGVLEQLGSACSSLWESSIESDVGRQFADFPALYRYLADHYQVGPK